mmetsp:Transcript_20936/g.42539  ORF Transcript_20936/g.42539 Transcript_20936/m.42539 type:complete len:582 (+) Transcript_20936:21-1766(+)
MGAAPFIGFGLDSLTGKVSVKQISIDDYPLIQGIMYFGILIPAFTAFIITLVVTIKGRRAIKAFREMKFNREHTARMLLDLRHHGGLTEAQEHAKEKEMEELKQEYYNKTNFFFFLDYQIGNPDKQLSIQSQVKFAFVHILVIGLAFLPLLIFANNWITARDAYECPLAVDQKACVESWPFPALVIYVLVGIHCIISFVELYTFYANLPWSRQRKILRLTWYTSQGFMVFLSIMYMLTVVCWIFIGLTITPSQYLPYVVGFVLSLWVLSRFAYKMLAEQKRLRKAIADRVMAYTERDFGRIEKEVVTNIVERNVNHLLKKQNLSLTAVTRGTFVLAFVLFVAQLFLFIGFHALTDVRDVNMGVFKSVVTAIAVLAIDAVVNRKRDFIIKKQNMALIVHNIITESKKGVTFVQNQVKIGEKMIVHMRKLLEEKERAELAKAEAEEVEVVGWGWHPDKWYKVPVRAAKETIHGDRYRGDGKRIAVDVLEEEPYVDMPGAMEPQDTVYQQHQYANWEPADTTYHPAQYAGISEESERGATDGPTVVMMLEGDDEGVADPAQLAVVLAGIMGVPPERFVVQVQDM